MSKCVDYSKWDNIDVSDDDEEEADHLMRPPSPGEDEVDLEADEEYVEGETVGGVVGREQQQRNGPQVSTLKPGSAVTIGPQGLTIREPEAGAAAKVASQTPFQSVRSAHQLSSSSNDTHCAQKNDHCAKNNAEDEKKWRKATRNGTYNAAEGYVFSQSKDAVTLGLILQEFSGNLPSSSSSLALARSIKSVEFQNSTTLLVKHVLGRGAAVSGGGAISPLFRSLDDEVVKVVTAYPIQFKADDEYHNDVMCPDWELVTIRVHHKERTAAHSATDATGDVATAEDSYTALDCWIRVLVIGEVAKEVVGSGAYLWWDRVLHAEKEPSIDLRRDVVDRTERTVQQSSKFAEAMESAHAEFKRRHAGPG